MTTNREWLYSLDVADLADWFDAEHVGTEERALDGDTAALESEYGKGGVVGGSFYDTPEQGEVVMPLESWREYLGAESENADSRERLEADIEEWASIMDLEDQIDMIHGWLNRRAAILEREMVKFNRRYFDCVEQDKKIAELTRKMEILKAHGVEIVDAVAGGYEVYNEKIREVSELQAQVDELQEKLRIGWECECKLQAERERYREKFGKCIDYADAIHALMDDEGMA